MHAEATSAGALLPRKIVRVHSRPPRFGNSAPMCRVILEALSPDPLKLCPPIRGVF
jgi:hypothetical protein